jgi:hypothetical protein
MKTRSYEIIHYEHPPRLEPTDPFAVGVVDATVEAASGVKAVEAFMATTDHRWGWVGRSAAVLGVGAFSAREAKAP